MDPAAAWGPFEFEQANRTTEDAAAEAWAPPGIPMQYYPPIETFGPTWSLPVNEPQSSGGQELVPYHPYYSTFSHQHRQKETSGKQVVDDPQNRETSEIVISNDSRARDVCNQVADEYKVHSDLMKQKMHRYPASLLPVDKCYTEPRVVSIGPYHHGLERLKPAEEVKHVAAIQCVAQSGCLLEDLYSKVASVADDIRCLYDKDVMAGIGYDEFRHMMFFDACFLVQYMRLWIGHRIDESLFSGFMGPNRRDIRHDVMLLENQIPWKVLQTTLSFTRNVRPEHLVFVMKGYLQDQKSPRRVNDDGVRGSPLDENYEPPHLLGLLRHYAVVKGNDASKATQKDMTKNISISISATELAENGIRLTAKKKETQLSHMGFKKEWTIFGKLSLVPLSLDHNRASYLVNMAALELCTVKYFTAVKDEDSAVCSYLLLLAILASRADDVRQLRTKGILQGGGGLTDEQVLKFFTSLQGLHRGRRYLRVMRDIQRYKENWWIVTEVYRFLYKYWKTITGVGSAVGALVGIIKAIQSIKKPL